MNYIAGENIIEIEEVQKKASVLYGKLPRLRWNSFMLVSASMADLEKLVLYRDCAGGDRGARVTQRGLTAAEQVWSKPAELK